MVDSHLTLIDEHLSFPNQSADYREARNKLLEAARAAQNGGKIHKEEESIGEYGFIALIIDPEGNMIGLHSMQ